MARINRSEVIQRAVNDLAISTSIDKIPTETLDKIQLTYDLNRSSSSFISSATSATTGTMTATMPTIDPRSEIYITSLDVDFSKDAACDIATGTGGAVNLTPNFEGIAKNFVACSVITLTAQYFNKHIDFAYPLRLKPNTNILLTGTYSLGVASRAMAVSGFIVSSN